MEFQKTFMERRRGFIEMYLADKKEEEVKMNITEKRIKRDGVVTSIVKQRMLDVPTLEEYKVRYEVREQMYHGDKTADVEESEAGIALVVELTVEEVRVWKKVFIENDLTSQEGELGIIWRD